MLYVSITHMIYTYSLKYWLKHVQTSILSCMTSQPPTFWFVHLSLFLEQGPSGILQCVPVIGLLFVFVAVRAHCVKHSRLEVLLKGLSWRDIDSLCTDAAVILRDQAEGCLLLQMNCYSCSDELAQAESDKSARDVDWESGSAGLSKLGLYRPMIT